jgi:hypothetical protein
VEFSTNDNPPPYLIETSNPYFNYHPEIPLKNWCDFSSGIVDTKNSEFSDLSSGHKTTLEKPPSWVFPDSWKSKICWPEKWNFLYNGLQALGL